MSGGDLGDSRNASSEDLARAFSLKALACPLLLPLCFLLALPLPLPFLSSSDGLREVGWSSGGLELTYQGDCHLV